MRKTILFLVVGLLTIGVALWNISPALADQGNVATGDQHFDDIDIGEDYTVTLPIPRQAPGGYLANDAHDGQASFANSFAYGGSGIGGSFQVTSYLQGNIAGASVDNFTPLNWFLPCPINVDGVSLAPGPTGAPGGGPAGTMNQAVGSEDFDYAPGSCAAMVAAGSTQDPQTSGAGLGGGQMQLGAFSEALYNFVSENWVDYNVPVRNIAGADADAYAGSTWSGTLDQDLATLFQWAGNNGGGGDTQVGTGPGAYLGINQVLDQGLAYLEGNHSNPFPGGISDTAIRGLQGDAQRIVQIFVNENTVPRNGEGVQARGTTIVEPTADIVHQWVADWMKHSNTNLVGGGNTDTVAGSPVTWTLETLLSSSMMDDPLDFNGGAEAIHQVNDQYSVYSASWAAGNSVANNPGNAQADVGVGNMVVGQSMGIEFWYDQSNIIPYDETIVGHTSAGENVISNIPIHDGDHNPLNN